MRLSASLTTLDRPLRASERTQLHEWLRRALRWQYALRGFPEPSTNAPDATPYVSLYAAGELLGCYGSHEGKPGERVGRAFLLALADRRYGGIAPSHRSELVAEIAYLRAARPVRADEAEAALEAGVHGVALVDEGVTTVLLPAVSRDRGLDARATLDVLWKKAGRERSDEGLVWLLDVETISSHGLANRNANAKLSATRWLESLVSAKGAVAFAVHPSSGMAEDNGVMRHGRIAVAIEALTALRSPAAKRARAWLSREIACGLRDASAVVGWPERADVVLGTLAVAARAGLDVPLCDLAAALDARAVSPWHAAQVASVLGDATPPALWERAVGDLEQHPFAPYLAMAARRRADAHVLERTIRALVAALSKDAPFAGGARVTAVPETALTAVAVEALLDVPTREAKQAVARGRAFVAARQVLDLPAAMHPRALGAYRASPITPILRCDVTAHAVLACFPASPSKRRTRGA